MKLGISSLAALALVTGCSTGPSENAATTESPVTGVPIGEVRGVVDITKTLQTRLFDGADAETAKFDVSRVAGPVFRLRKQLGVFALEGTTSTYLGGTPTPLRATLWHQVMGRFGTAIGEMCLIDPTVVPPNKVTFASYASGPNGEIVAPASFRLRAEIASVIANACSFDGNEQTRRELAGALWDAFMGHGGTLAADKDAFVTAFAADGAPALKAAPKDRVADMAMAMLLNPHFLLAK
jgi:hypothetical protein